MIKLIEPEEKYIKSYMELYDEYQEKNVKTYELEDARIENIIKKYKNYKEEKNLKPGRVGAIYYWLVDDEKDYVIGGISIRYKLTDALLKYGGNIGYFVRYSEWNNGYGTVMLKMALEKAHEMNISKILITCDDDNYGSSRVIEKNGGKLENKIENYIQGKKVLTRRYWIYLK